MTNRYSNPWVTHVGKKLVKVSYASFFNLSRENCLVLVTLIVSNKPFSNLSKNTDEKLKNQLFLLLVNTMKIHIFIERYSIWLNVTQAMKLNQTSYEVGVPLKLCYFQTIRVSGKMFSYL